MWAHGDVSRQRDPGIQELSWDIPKLHSLWEENPSASGKTPDLKDWRPGYRITEMRIQLPYHPELLNVARYVKDKAVVDARTGKSVSKSRHSKMQETSALRPFRVRACRCGQARPSPLAPCAVRPRLGVPPCRAARGPPGPRGLVPGAGTSTPRALPSALRSFTITALVQQARGCISAPYASRVGEELTNWTEARWEAGVGDPACPYFLGSSGLGEEITFIIASC